MLFLTCSLLNFLIFALSVNIVGSEKYEIIIIPISRNRYNNVGTFLRQKRTNGLNDLDYDYQEKSRDTTNIDDIDYIFRADDISGESSDTRSDGDNNYGDDKIVGGDEVDINLYPYHAAYGTNCGGAIIDRKWIITAGHCGRKTYVRVGSKYLNQGMKVNVKRRYVHPKWSASTKEHPFDFDFQLLELEHPLKFGENIHAIKIAHIEDMVIGKVVTVTGWGNTVENGPFSTVLRAIRVPIISKDNCQRVKYPYFRGTLTPRMFCAGFQEGIKDACQGDSGGPAASNDRLLGIISFGYGCATPGAYGVYSKVAKVRDWIEETTGLKLQ